MSVATTASTSSTEREATRARIRSVLCDEVPLYGITLKGKARKFVTPINLDEIADLIVDVVMKARGE